MTLSDNRYAQALKFNYVDDFYRNLGNANEKYEHTRAYLYRITDFDGEVELAKDYLFFPKTKNEFLGFFHISHQDVLKALGRKRLSRKLLAELEILVANSADIILDRKKSTI